MRSFLHGAVQLHVLHHAAEHPIHGAWMAAELAHSLGEGIQAFRHALHEESRLSNPPATQEPSTDGPPEW